MILINIKIFQKLYVSIDINFLLEYYICQPRPIILLLEADRESRLTMRFTVYILYINNNKWPMNIKKNIEFHH